MRALHVYLLLGVFPLLAGTRPAAGQPSAVTRTLRTIDFEERRAGNLESTPMHWVKVEGPGLPHYVDARLATDAARSGRFSFRFDLNGGSLVYRYLPSRVPVQRHASYRVESWVRTTPLQRARARMSATLVDGAGNPLPGRTVHSQLFASPPGDDSWHKLELTIAVGDEPAEAMVIELGLLQPAIYSDRSLGNRAILAQDIRGSAWFDDVTVAQVPSVRIRPDRPGAVFRRGDPLRLHVLVNDRFLDDLAGRLVVRDASGHEVYQRSGDLEPGSARDVAPGSRRLTLTLPDLPTGWYQASLQMSSNGAVVGEETLGFIRLADDGEPLPPDQRFAVSADAAPRDVWSELPTLLPTLGFGRVSVSVWQEGAAVEAASSLQLDRLLEQLRDVGVSVTASLTALPPELARRAGGVGLERLSALPRDTWQPPLAFVVSRHGRQIADWRFGDRSLARSMVDRDELRGVYRNVRSEFEQLLMSPRLAIPWPAWNELPAEAPPDVTLVVPGEVLPENIPLYLSEATTDPARRQITVSLVPLDRADYGRETQLRDLVQRVAWSLSAGPHRIELPLPFLVRDDEAGASLEPTEEALVLRTVLRVLGHSEFRGRVPIGEGVEAMLFERDEQGILLLWSRGEGATARSLEVNVGTSPVRVDLAGNVASLPAASSGRVRLEVGAMPFFLVGVDVGQALLRASASLDNPLLESSFKPHTRVLRFVNPYRHAISGSLRVSAPTGWSVMLNTPTFSLNPGETYQQPLTIEFPFSSTAGARTLNLEFRMQDGEQGAFVVPLEVRLGLGDVGLQSIALRDGDDVIVQQMVTNYGQKPIDYTAFVVYPGQARQERLISGLGAGKTTLKRYRFTQVAPGGGVKIRSGLRELDGIRVLNDEVELR
jgi:hypothetical protein